MRISDSLSARFKRWGVSWETGLPPLVGLDEIMRPGKYAEGDPAAFGSLDTTMARVLASAKERQDAYTVIMSHPHLVPVLRQAVKRVERERWADAGALAELLSKGGDPDAATKLLACHNPDHGQWLVFPVGDKPPEYKRERCWLRVCPTCAPAFAKKLRARYESRIAVVMSQNVPGWGLKKLELTMRRGPDLATDLADLHKMTKKLVHHFWGKDKRAGAFGAAEIGPQGGNVHSHIVVYGCYVSQKKISKYWEKLSRKHRRLYTETNEGDGDRVVWIKGVAAGAAVREAIKYITKFAKHEEGDEGAPGFALPIEDLAALHFALKGKRRAWSWGSFYGVDDMPEEDDSDPAELETEDTRPAGDRPFMVSHTELVAVLNVLHSTVENNCTVSRYPPVKRVGAGPP